MLAKFPFGGPDTIRRVVPDVRAARGLEAGLAKLARPWRCLRNRRAAAQDGPPWVRCLAFHPARGIALVDLLPTNPQFAVEPLAGFFAQSGLAEAIGGLPAIAPLALAEPASTAALTRMLEAALPVHGDPSLAEGWVEIVVARLMQTPGLLLGEIPRALDPLALAATAPVPPLGSQDFGPPPPPPPPPRIASLEGPEPGTRAGQVLAREQEWQSRRRLALGAGGALLLTALVASAMTLPALMPAHHATPVADATPLIPPPAAPVKVPPAGAPPDTAVLPAEPSLPEQAVTAPPAAPAPPVHEAISSPATPVASDHPAKPAPHRMAAPDNLPMGMTPRAPPVTIQSEPQLAAPSLSMAAPADLPPVPAGALVLSGPPPVAAPRAIVVAAPPPVVRPMPMRRYQPRRYAGRTGIEIRMPHWLSTMFSSR